MLVWQFELNLQNLTIGSYVSVRPSRYEARGKFGEHERCVLECSPNFPSASYLDEHTADVWTNCFITFSTRWKIFSLEGFVCWQWQWACTIGIWSTLAQLNLFIQIYLLCYKGICMWRRDGDSSYFNLYSVNGQVNVNKYKLIKEKEKIKNKRNLKQCFQDSKQMQRIKPCLKL